MEFKRIVEYINNFWRNTIAPSLKSLSNERTKDTDKIVSAIEGKEHAKHVKVNNLSEVSIPLMEASRETTEAIKGIKIPESQEIPDNSAKFDELGEIFN